MNYLQDVIAEYAYSFSNQVNFQKHNNRVAQNQPNTQNNQNPQDKHNQPTHNNEVSKILQVNNIIMSEDSKILLVQTDQLLFLYQLYETQQNLLYVINPSKIYIHDDINCNLIFKKYVSTQQIKQCVISPCNQYIFYITQNYINVLIPTIRCKQQHFINQFPTIQEAELIQRIEEMEIHDFKAIHYNYEYLSNNPQETILINCQLLLILKHNNQYFFKTIQIDLREQKCKQTVNQNIYCDTAPMNSKITFHMNNLQSMYNFSVGDVKNYFVYQNSLFVLTKENILLAYNINLQFQFKLVYFSKQFMQDNQLKFFFNREYTLNKDIIFPYLSVNDILVVTGTDRIKKLLFEHGNPVTTEFVYSIATQLKSISKQHSFSINTYLQLNQNNVNRMQSEPRVLILSCIFDEFIGYYIQLNNLETALKQISKEDMKYQMPEIVNLATTSDYACCGICHRDRLVNRLIQYSKQHYENVQYLFNNVKLCVIKKDYFFNKIQKENYEILLRKKAELFQKALNIEDLNSKQKKNFKLKMEQFKQLENQFLMEQFVTVIVDDCNEVHVFRSRQSQNINYYQLQFQQCLQTQEYDEREDDLDIQKDTINFGNDNQNLLEMMQDKCDMVNGVVQLKKNPFMQMFEDSSSSWPDFDNKYQ